MQISSFLPVEPGLEGSSQFSYSTCSGLWDKWHRCPSRQSTEGNEVLTPTSDLSSSTTALLMKACCCLCAGFLVPVLLQYKYFEIFCGLLVSVNIFNFHPCQRGDSGGGQWLVRMEWRPAGWLVSASVNIPLHHKVQKFSSGTSSPGWSRKKGRKMVVVV